MGNGIQITGLASSFDLGASNFGADAAPALALGASVSRAAAALPASTTGNLFTVTGGRILLTGIVGQVTTVIQTQACNASLSACGGDPVEHYRNGCDCHARRACGRGDDNALDHTTRCDWPSDVCYQLRRNLLEDVVHAA
jgi:hypothetical protein